MRNEDPSHSWQTSLFPWNWCWEQARLLWNTFYMKFCPLEGYRESRMQSNLHASGQPWKEPTEWVVSMILSGNSEFWTGSQHLRERAVGGALNPVQCLGTQCWPIDEGGLAQIFYFWTLMRLFYSFLESVQGMRKYVTLISIWIKLISLKSQGIEAINWKL